MKNYIPFILLFAMFSAHSQQATTVQALGDLTNTRTDSFTFAIIGDYGDDSKGELLTAEMVKGWNPLFIVTTGDNDYEDKNGKGIDTNITKYYSSYINADLHKDRFFPCLGNHDQTVSEKAKVIDEYFRLFSFLNRAENYDFTWGPVHFYSLNSGPNGKVGFVDPATLKDVKPKLAKDTDPFHLVFFHHPFYSSEFGMMPAPDRFDGYNMDAILNGHIHYYERMTDSVRHIEYITIGCSGRNDSQCGDKLSGNKEIVLHHCEDKQNGALKVTVVKLYAPDKKESWRMTFEYYNAAKPGAPLDTWTILK